MSKKKDVVVHKETAISTNVQNLVPKELQGLFDPTLMGAVGDTEDLVVAKIWQLQGTSKCVTDKTKGAISGEYRNSRTLDLIAGLDKTFNVFVISNYKSWQVFHEVDVVSGKKTVQEMQYLETIPYLGNEDLKFDDTDKNGKIIHRDQVLGFYVILESELNDGIAFPYVIDFKRSSRDAGKDLSTAIQKLSAIGVPSYGKVFTIGGATKTNEKNTWYVKTVIESGAWINKPQLETITSWARELQKRAKEGKVKVDESDVKNDKSDINTTATEVNKETKSKF